MTTTVLTPTQFEIKPLPYAYDALAPAISSETLHYHHDKHYAGYVDKLNLLVADTPYADRSLEEIIATSDGAIFNNAAQAWNHEFFFEQFSPTPQTQPMGPLREAIDRDFGSVEQLHAALRKASVALFGSGWVWLVKDSTGHLSLLSTRNAGTPIRHGLVPLICFDVWEHAYYLDYQNRRADAVDASWGLIDWQKVAQRYRRGGAGL